MGVNRNTVQLGFSVHSTLLVVTEGGARPEEAISVFHCIPIVFIALATTESTAKFTVRHSLQRVLTSIIVQPPHINCSLWLFLPEIRQVVQLTANWHPVYPNSIPRDKYELQTLSRLLILNTATERNYIKV